MKAVAVAFGFLAAIVIGAIALFTVGDVAGIVVFLLILAIAIYAIVAPRGILNAIAGSMVILFIAGSAFVAWQAVQIFNAFGNTDGPADPANPVALAAANDKIDAIDRDGGFRLALDEQEIEAVIQDGLSDGDVPLRTVSIDIVDGEGDEPGTLEFTGEFKSGSLDVDGAVTATLDAGAVKIELIKVDLGALSLPGLAEGAIEDLVESVTDLNQTLADNQADVQSITLANDQLVITGTQGTGAVLTADTLLTGLAEQAAAVGSGVEPPPEVLGPGVVNSTSSDGASYYVALGDSLAANVGVEEARDGYVSRFHRFLQDRDGATYGLRNFGISGETTGTLIRGGQLDEAVVFMEDNPVDYVSIDIGANDLLGHLGSPDCSESLDTPACTDRLTSTFTTYEANMSRIFDAIEDAAPDATVIFMRAYNPFSLGFGAAVGLETTSNEILSDFNDIAARLAAERGIRVADAFSPMLNTTAVTTHMLDPVPDIHPYPIGFDILAQSLVEALG